MRYSLFFTHFSLYRVRCSLFRIRCESVFDFEFIFSFISKDLTSKPKKNNMKQQQRIEQFWAISFYGTLLYLYTRFFLFYYNFSSDALQCLHVRENSHKIHKLDSNAMHRYIVLALCVCVIFLIFLWNSIELKDKHQNGFHFFSLWIIQF